MPKNEIKTDPFIEALNDETWMERLMDSKHPSAMALEHYIFHTVIPAAVRGRHEDDGTFDRLVADMLIDCPELRPQPKQGESK